MGYEVKQDEVTDEKWAEMRQIAKNNICAECEGELTIHTIPENKTIAVGCLNREHHGYIERTTYTQELRRGAGVPLVVQSAIERKMLQAEELSRAMNMLALRYPMAIVDPPTAALFVMDCYKLGLEPLIQPPEAIPIPFKRKLKDGKGNVTEVKVAITMIITEDGWLSMAARGCKEDWVGPPRTMRIEEYLAGLPENKKKTREEIQAIARDIKKSKCNDPEAWYYVAVGKRRGGEDTVIPGYFTHADHQTAQDRHTPASTQPGNQARVRAIKRWVREVFPECRQRMIELTAEWYQRAAGIKEAEQYIDAEYSFIRLPESGEKIGETALKTAGTTILSPPEGKKAQKSRVAPPAPAAEGEGFSIDLAWLGETLKRINWSEATVKTFLVSKFKVSPDGTLEEVIKRLTREQAEEFTREIQERAEQPALFD